MAAEWTVYHRQTPAEAALARRARGRVLVLEGLPGAGKTTATRRMQESCERCLGLEVVDLTENMRPPLLAYFCENPKERAGLTQLTMMEKRVFEMVEAARAAERGALVIIDRSIDGDLAFALRHHGDGNISDRVMRIYHDERTFVLNKLRRLGPGYWPEVTATLFFNVPTDVLKQRIVARGDPAEIDLYCVKDPGYLDRLAESYAAALAEGAILRVEWLDEHPNFALEDGDCQALLTALLDLAGVPADDQEEGEGEAVGRLIASAFPVADPDGPALTDLYAHEDEDGEWESPFIHPVSRLD